MTLVYEAFAVLVLGEDEVSERQPCVLTITRDGTISMDREVVLHPKRGGAVEVRFSDVKQGHLCSLWPEPVPGDGAGCVVRLRPKLAGPV